MKIPPERAGEAKRPFRAVHAGHRARLRKRAAEYGLDSFEPHEIIELLLFLSIPRSNTNETAHGLLDDAGSLRALLREPPERLTRQKGIGKASARLILSVLPSFAEAMTNALRNIRPLSRWSLLAAADFRMNIAGECAAVLLLSREGALLSWQPAWDAEVLPSLVSAARESVRTPVEDKTEPESPAGYAVVLREDAARAYLCGSGPAPSDGGHPDFGPLRDLFPDAAGIHVILPERRMRDL